MTSAALPTVPAPSTTARRLAYAGLIPFVAGALLVWLVYEEVRAETALALTAYAALVVSFLGGMHWGLLLRQPEPAPRLLLWGVLPTLLAWPTLLMSPDAGLVILGALLVAGYLVDRRVYPVLGAAHWLTLRFRLSGMAALSCFIAAAAS